VAEGVQGAGDQRAVSREENWSLLVMSTP